MEAIEAARAIGGTDHVAQLAVSDQREHEARYLRVGQRGGTKQVEFCEDGHVGIGIS